MENETFFLMSKCSLFYNACILKNLTFQRPLKALVWSKGLKVFLKGAKNGFSVLFVFKKFFFSHYFNISYELFALN